MNMLVSNNKKYGLVLVTLLMIISIQIVTYAQEDETDDILAVSDRTSQVSDTIIAAVSGVTDAANVTETHLAAITRLNLRNKVITSLKSGDFSGMTGLTDLNLYGNQLSSLPDGIFEGLTALTTLRLGGNTVDPMQIDVSLEEVGTNEYKVSIPTGAPFATTVSIVLRDGINPETLRSVTVAKGSVESASFTAPSVSGATVEIGGTLPALPLNHYGYALTKVVSSSETETETQTPQTPEVPIVTEVTENSAPTFTDGTTTIRSIAENTPANTNISTAVAATDANTGDTLTYTLGGRDAASFAIVSTTGQLQTKAALDYETKSVYLVSVTVSDGSISDTISIIINVIDVADTTISTVSLGVSDRTPEVRDAIVAAVPSVTDAANVTTAHLAAITALDLRNEGITTLKAGDFSGLTVLTSLNLYGNMLSSLPDGIFSELTSLTSLRLGGNNTDPMPIIVSLEQVSSNQYRVVIPTGAPFDVSVPIVITDGRNAPGRFDTVTVSKGSVRSEATTGAYIDIGALPSLPENHFGYVLSKSATCNVTLQVAEAIAVAVPGVEDCRNVSQAQLAAITSLNLSNKSITSLQSNDFTDLLSLTTLNLENNLLSSLPDGIFAGMTSLNTLQLSGNTSAPFSFEVSLQKVGTNQFKAVLPIGAPFDISLPITVANGSAANSASSITISQGSVESEALTTGAVTVDIGTLPSIPTTHNGYALSKSTDLPLEILGATIVVENKAPVFTDGANATRTIAENTPLGTNIGSPVAATDADTSDTLTYALDGTDANVFSIVSSTGQLQTKLALNYESKQNYKITVTATDGKSGSDSITVTINVTNVVNEVTERQEQQVTNIAPVFTDGATATRSIAENTIAGTNIGASVIATDANTLDTLTYTLSGTDAASFAIGATSGQLQTKATLDYETKNSYSVTITVSDGKNGTDTITVTINVTDVNENVAPVFTDGATATRSIAENTIAGTNIGTPVAAIDANILDILAYTLIGADAASFAIVSRTGQLQTKATLDYETKNSYSVTITVSDGKNGTDTITVTINVTDVNENVAPVFTDGATATRSIAENTIAGTNIGASVIATDANTLDTLTYTLSGTDAASFAIGATSGQLQTKATLDYETKNSYSVTITVSDGKNGTDTITVTINVTDVVEGVLNNAPVFIGGDTTTRSIAENTASGTNIGSVVTATDDDTSDTLTYTLGGVDANSFTIVETSGQLQTAAALNYENKNTYTATATVSDNKGGTDSIVVTINVTDANDAPVFSDGTSTTRNVNENTAAGTNIGTPIPATDADTSDTLTYTLSGTDAASFAIAATTGQLQTKATLDYETKNSYSVTITVSDGKNGTDTITVTINVTDVNENVAPVFTDGATATRSIAENTIAGTNIGASVIATDANTSDTLTYTLSGTDAASFAIGATSGQLQTKATLDYETKNSYSVTITVSDGKNGTDTITVTINVTDVVEGVPNNAPVFIGGDTTTRSIAENTASGTNIGSVVTATDDDTSDTLTYTLGGVDANSFTIVETSGQLQTAAALNYENKNTYTATATVSDNKGGTDSIVVTINVTDANDAPVFSDGTSTTRNVNENTAATNIGTPVPATDADTSDTLTYTLSGTDAASFAIAATTGQLQTKATLDYETKNSYSVTITVSDGKNGTDTITVTINVTDVNENVAPVFTDGATATRSIAENTIAGTNIGASVIATDANTSDTLTYTLGGTDAASFDIGATTGQLQTRAALDYETKNSYSVTITVSDGKNGTDTITVTINVTDVVESVPNNAPVFIDGNTTTRSIAENTASGTNIGSVVTATDDDTSDTLTYTLGGVDANSFTIVETSGQLQTAAALNYENKNTYTATATVSDNKGGTDSIVVTINVTDVNDAPVFSDGTSTTRNVNENTAATNIGTPVPATDADTSDTLTYTLSGTDAASFAIAATTGQLQTKATLDYETKNSYSVTITVSDGKNGTDTITVTINVTDVNENVAPVFTDGATATRSIAENTIAGTNIGASVIATDANTSDANTSDTLTYTLSGTDAASFAIGATTGQLQTRAALDYETKNSYSVTVTVSDGKNGTDTIAVTINVTDVNENVAPVFTDGATATRSIAENTIAGTNIGASVIATDANTSDTLTYTLGGTDAASFAIVATSGQLQTKATLDYETKNSYSVTITVSDGKNGTDTITVTINVTDVVEGVPNNAPVFIDGNTTTRSIAENRASGTNISSVVTATDDDTSDTLTYTLGGVDANSFTIVETSGQLQTSAALNYENKNTYTATVTVSDNKGGTDSIVVTINVTDVNDPPRFVDGTSATITIPENTGSSPIPIGVFNVIDEDRDRMTFFRLGPGADTFRYEYSGGLNYQTQPITSTGRGYVRIFIPRDTVLDYETKTSYSLTLAMTDTKGATGQIHVTINLTDVANEPPPPPPPPPTPPTANTVPYFWDSTGSDAASTAREIAENAGPGENIGNPIGATDRDNDPLTFTLGGTDRALFDIASNGQLRTKSVLEVLPFDYETKSSYSITVSVSDGRDGSSTISVTINITDKPEAPEFTDGDSTTRTISENSAADINIGSAVSATDQDNRDSVTYTLGDTDAALFSIDEGTGQLKTKAALDYETKASYTVTITATDTDDLTDSITVTINVRNLDETPSNNAPVFTEGATATRSVAENLVAGTNIGTAVTATDTDPGSTLSYQLSGTDGAAFSIDESTGQLKTNAALNYETKDAYSVTITVTDGTLTDTITVTINVTDANDAPVFSDGTSTTRNASKNTDADTNIGASVIATDEDEDTLTYTLSGTDAASFDIVLTSGQMKTKAALNFETKAFYEVTVTVSDGSGGTDSIAVTINVNDINENTGEPAFTERPSMTRSIPENTAADVNIGEPLTATDIDNDTLRYYLVGSFDYTSFSIDNSTGQLKTKASLDREQKSSYTLQVGVKDAQYHDSILIDIEVTDVNEVTAFTEGDSTTRSITEDVATRINIGTPILATDEDNDILTYTLSGTDAAEFSIVATTGQLQTKAVLDYETKTSYTVTVTASDGRGGTDTITVTINVTDVVTEANSAPEFTEGAATTRSVAENTAAGESIGSAVSATDADNDTLTYSLSGTDAASFDIDPSTGQLLTNAALDYETKSSYNVTITVSDGKTNGTDTITVTISVTDQDSENTPPVFTEGASTTRTIAEHADEDWEDLLDVYVFNIGAPIAATDADGDTLAYEIVDGPDSYFFRIDSSGQLRTSRWIDYEQTPSRSVTITVSDGNGGTDSIDVTFNVTDVNEQPYFGTSIYPSYSGSTTIRYARHGAGTSTNIGDPVTASDPDANTTLTYSLSGTDASSFTIGSTIGQLTNNSVLDVNTKDSYSVVVTASDGSLSATINVTINVIQQPDPLVSSRSPAVREVIVNAISDVNSPNDVTAIHLANITRLDLSSKSIASLSPGDFNDLVSLENLDLSGNNLISLQAGIFDHLTSLENLDLSSNRLTSLQAGIFDHLTSLDVLLLDYNQISSISGDIFENNTNLEFINLRGNRLSSLPDGIFEGLSSLGGVQLSQDSGEAPDINIGLVAVDDEDGNSQTAKYKVTVHTGSVQNLGVEVWSVQSSDGNLTFDRKHQTVRVSTGSVESSEITIDRSEFPSNNSAIYLAVRQDKLPPGNITYFDPTIGGFYYRANQTPLLMLPAQEAGAPFVDGRESVPVSTELLPNFPNPFNPETWIPYQLAKPSDVSITIYDIRGNLVRQLTLGQQKAGFYTDRARAAHWDGRNSVGERVANGVYFYQLQAGSVSFLRKMVILK